MPPPPGGNGPKTATPKGSPPAIGPSAGPSPGYETVAWRKPAAMAATFRHTRSMSKGDGAPTVTMRPGSIPISFAAMSRPAPSPAPRTPEPPRRRPTGQPPPTAGRAPAPGAGGPARRRSPAGGSGCPARRAAASAQATPPSLSAGEVLVVGGGRPGEGAGERPLIAVLDQRELPVAEAVGPGGGAEAGRRVARPGQVAGPRRPHRGAGDGRVAGELLPLAGRRVHPGGHVHRVEAVERPDDEELVADRVLPAGVPLHVQPPHLRVDALAAGVAHPVAGVVGAVVEAGTGDVGGDAVARRPGQAPGGGGAGEAVHVDVGRQVDAGPGRLLAVAGVGRVVDRPAGDLHHRDAIVVARDVAALVLRDVEAGGARAVAGNRARDPGRVRSASAALGPAGHRHGRALRVDDAHRSGVAEGVDGAVLAGQPVAVPARSG